MKVGCRYIRCIPNHLSALFVIALLATPILPVQTQPHSDASELSEILQRMSAHEEWQKRHLVEYHVARKFFASNPRFNKEAVLEVKTVFRRPSTFDSEIIRSEGSSMIRERVFDKILEAEREANTDKAKLEASITPKNYNFTWLGKKDCGGRPCYNLRITPKQKSKYSVDGQIWVDAEDASLVRIQGSPAKRPSLWTLSTQIERRYKRIGGVWLCDSMESTSNILIGGLSTLRIDYNYLKVETEAEIE